MLLGELWRASRRRLSPASFSSTIGPRRTARCPAWRSAPCPAAPRAKFEDGKPGSETRLPECKDRHASEIHGKQIVAGSTHGPAAGDVAVLHSPFFGSGKLEYYLAARRPALEVRGL